MNTLSLETVVSSKERKLYQVALIVAIAGWVVLTLLSCGTVWIAAALLAVVAWFSNGLLVAGLKANAVSVHPRQLGRLDKTFRDVCLVLQVDTVPELYVIESGGILNAFATRHSGRHFVVVHSDMLEALGPDSMEMKFLLGHEIGHIRRNHVFLRLLLIPALILPILGPAYSRSCESSCDRHGAFAAGDIDSSMRAMMTLAGGREAAREMDPVHFAEQNISMRGFFVSWYELVSGYPTLARRIRDLLEIKTGNPSPAPPRHPLSWLLALISFGGGFGGRGSILITLFLFYFIGIFAAMMIPAVEGFRRARAESVSTTASQPSDTSSSSADNSAPNTSPGAALYSSGKAKLDSKNYQSAIADFTQSIKADPDVADVYNERAIAEEDKGDDPGAVGDYQQAIAINPSFASAMGNLAWLLATSCDPAVRNGAKAVYWANRSCELTDWQDGDSIDTLAAACAEAGDFDSAIKWETKYLKTNPSDKAAAARLVQFQNHQPYHQKGE